MINLLKCIGLVLLFCVILCLQHSVVFASGTCLDDLSSSYNQLCNRSQKLFSWEFCSEDRRKNIDIALDLLEWLDKKSGVFIEKFGIDRGLDGFDILQEVTYDLPGLVFSSDSQLGANAVSASIIIESLLKVELISKVDADEAMSKLYSLEVLDSCLSYGLSNKGYTGFLVPMANQMIVSRLRSTEKRCFSQWMEVKRVVFGLIEERIKEDAGVVKGEEDIR